MQIFNFAFLASLIVSACWAKKALLSSPIASAVCEQWRTFKETKVIQAELKTIPVDVRLITACENWLWNRCKGKEKDCNTVELSECLQSQRVLGGEKARSDEFPWDVSIRFIYDWGSFYPEPRKAEDVMANDFKGLKEAHRCTGTLYSPSYILTSAWCAERAKEYIVTKNRFVAWISRGVFLDAKMIEALPGKKKKGEIFVHPKFKLDTDTPYTKDHDIALLKMPNDFKFSKLVHSLEVAPEAKNFSGTRAEFTGWGTTSESITDSMLGQAGSTKPGYGSALFKLALTVVPFQGVCEDLVHKYLELQNNYDPKEDLSKRYLCAKADNPEAQGACGGDLGGPLICSEGGKRYFCGIRNAWSIITSCPSPDDIEIFVRPSYYLEWIESIAGKQLPKDLNPIK
jgi:chymotrypsin